MPPDALAAAAAPSVAAALTATWRTALVRLSAAWLALLLLFASEWEAMIGQWWNSSTYNHILLIPAIIAWLLWVRAPQMLRLTPTPWSPGLIAVGAAALLWMLGSFAGFSLASQAGAVAMLAACVPALLGPQVTVGVLFPLAYMAFLIPFGDELVPALQIVTAKLTIALTHASGIPAAVDGVFIDTPAGLFEVAEACSGVKFLVAMVAFGALVANVCFHSWRRRALFMAVAIAMPILANGIRAWGTIYVAQGKGAAYAGGFDHIVFGWLFFAAVMIVTLGVAWPYFDRPSNDPAIDPEAIQANAWLARLSPARSSFRVCAALAMIPLVAMAWTHAAERLSAPLASQIHLPDVPGWSRVDYKPELWWEPRAAGANHRLLGRYADRNGRTIDVFYALYASQGEGREAGGFGEGALPGDGSWSWLGGGAPVDDAKTDRLLAQGRFERVTETRYRTGDLLTGSNLSLKLANIGDRLQLRARPTMLLILSAERHGRTDPADTLARFRSAAGPMGEWMDRIGSVR